MRLTLLAGHYGSGKTTLAIQCAIDLRAHYDDVRLCDLDIVNPYFRAHHARGTLEAAGVRLITSPWADSTVELAGFPPEAASVFDAREGAAVIDLGGDDRGALAIGRFAHRLADCEILLVGNRYRPLTGTAEAARSICREIEAAGRFRFTGFINNSNLGALTTANDVANSLPWACELCEALQLPLYATAVRADLAEALAGTADKLWAITGTT